MTYLREAVERLNAVAIPDDHWAFLGDSGAWYTLPMTKMLELGLLYTQHGPGEWGGKQDICILELEPQRMPDGWQPPAVSISRCLNCELIHDADVDCGFAALVRLEAKRQSRENV